MALAALGLFAVFVVAQVVIADLIADETHSWILTGSLAITSVIGLTIAFTVGRRD